MTTSADLRVMPVGGLGEMGGHHMVVDVGEDSFLIDCGALFPLPWDIGVEHLVPDLRPALKRLRQGRLRGLLLTHGHRDHIGGVAHLLSLAPGLPVYATPFAMGLLRRALEGGERFRPHIVRPGDSVDFGASRATWFGVTHSLPEACSLALETPYGTVVHSGDFRVQEAPLLGRPTDIAGLRALGDRGVDLALVDSTGASRPGRTLPESEVAENLRRVVAETDGLVVVTSFSSHVERVVACVDAALAEGRTPAVYGRSLEATVSLARDMGMFGDRGTMLGRAEDVARLGRRGLLVVTGTQGEWRAPLARIARGEDSRVRLQPGDRVVWSARAIPGNERAIGLVVSGLLNQGVSVEPPWGTNGLHTSGHGRRDEVADWLSWVRPKAILPIHGEAWHLVEHRRVLLEAAEGADVLDLRSGGSVLLEDGVPRVVPATERPPFSAAVAGGLWEPTETALRARRSMGRHGVVTAVLDGVGVHVVTVGLFAEDEAEEREQDLARRAEAALREPTRESSEEIVRLTLRRTVRKWLGERVWCVVRRIDPERGK